MRVCLAIVFALATASAALADDLDLPRRLTLEPQEEMPASRHLEQNSGETFTEWIFRRSELEIGATYTDYDDDLRISSGIGGYVRPGLALTDNAHVTLAYRQTDVSHESLPGGISEDVRVQGVFAGVGYRLPIVRDIDLSLHAAVGSVRWESELEAVGHDTGPAFSGEAAVTVLIDGYIRVRGGVAVDGARTDFHQTSDGTAINLVYLLGLEIRH